MIPSNDARLCILFVGQGNHKGIVNGRNEPPSPSKHDLLVRSLFKDDASSVALLASSLIKYETHDKPATSWEPHFGSLWCGRCSFSLVAEQVNVASSICFLHLSFSSLLCHTYYKFCTKSGQRIPLNPFRTEPQPRPACSRNATLLAANN